MIWHRYCWCIFFICLRVCVFLYMFVSLFQYFWDTHRMISWKFCKYLTWFGWDIYDLKMFICLYVCLFVCLFVLFFNHLRIPPEWFCEHFCKDQTWFSWDIGDLKFSLFVCLFFVCLNHHRIHIGCFFSESVLKIWLNFA